MMMIFVTISFYLVIDASRPNENKHSNYTKVKELNNDKTFNQRACRL